MKGPFFLLRLSILIGYPGFAYPQSITFTDVKIVQRQFHDSAPPNFTKGSDRVLLTYREKGATIYFQGPEKNLVYEYTVHGLFSQEITTRDSFVVLPYLPNGEFVLQVSVPSRPTIPPARLTISVESPLWLRWWFLPMLFLYGILFVGIVMYFLYRYRLRQVLRIQLIRENIARDLHDDMGSHLSSISMLSQTVSNVAEKDSAHARLLVDKIGETARQVMDAMSDIVWSINPEHDSLEHLLMRMRDVAADLFEDQPVTLHYQVDDAVSHTAVPLQQRRDFFLIYKEALTNCRKYALPANIWISLKQHVKFLSLTIEDDGVGFDTNGSTNRNPLGSNGIKNMHIRAAKLSGTITIQSSPGAGTTLILRIPGANLNP